MNDDTQHLIRTLAAQLARPDRTLQSAPPSSIDPRQLKRLARLFRAVIYTGYFDPRPLGELLEELAAGLADQCARAFAMRPARELPDPASRGREAARRLLEELPELRRRLGTDVQAIFEGDPAASSPEEVILCYPGLVAITHYRLAHALWRLEVPILPRMLAEAAHSATGIDIHPGAVIGDSFSIDHGTGVVIGETTTIGEHVKLYQGVTLGAKSFELDEHGNPVKGIKRHPDIGNHVVVYAGATILGGMTHIGDNCVIGGNVWLTHSIEAGRTVLAAEERGTKII